MSTIINATTTNGVVIQPDNSGSLVLQTNNGTTALTIDTSQNVAFAKGFTVGSTAAPAFSVTRSTTSVNYQSINNATQTKVAFTEETFDTANCFDSSTNYRFTPNVAGYYQINWSLIIDLLSSTTEYIVSLYKNGSSYVWGSNLTASGSHYNAISGSALVYLNGSTDYIELYVFQNSGSAKNIFVGEGTFPSRFSGAMLRSA
jgi:hypothetical protein